MIAKAKMQDTMRIAAPILGMLLKYFYTILIEKQ